MENDFVKFIKDRFKELIEKKQYSKYTKKYKKFKLAYCNTYGTLKKRIEIEFMNNGSKIEEIRELRLRNEIDKIDISFLSDYESKTLEELIKEYSILSNEDKKKCIDNIIKAYDLFLAEYIEL